MEILSLEEFNKLAQKAQKVAVSAELSALELAPIDLYKKLKQELNQDGVILEDFSENSPRYSYICFDTIETLNIPYDSNINILDALRAFYTKYNINSKPELAHLITSNMGFVSYDAATSFVDIPPPNNNSLPLCLFHLYGLSICSDHNNKKILISIIAEPNETAYQAACKKIHDIIGIIQSPSNFATPAIKLKTSNTINTDVADSDFMAMVKKAKEYIIRGDAFQIVLSRCFKRSYTVEPLEIYQLLREINPAPFMFYFPISDQTIIGASPETLANVKNKQVKVNPIAGTRKRLNITDDEVIEADLLSDNKELAEHMMLVDLARNDVGSVSIPGTVQVSEMLRVKHYPHISHLCSTVVGTLDEKNDVFDVLKNTIPAGTLSGAPKIRAMEIIAELEKKQSPRGLYGGAICRFDLANNFESCIAIRMAVLKDGIATVRTGAGIVYDSDPFKEAQETYQKAYGILDTIAKAHEV